MRVCQCRNQQALRFRSAVPVSTCRTSPRLTQLPHLRGADEYPIDSIHRRTTAIKASKTSYTPNENVENGKATSFLDGHPKPLTKRDGTLVIPTEVMHQLARPRPGSLPHPWGSGVSVCLVAGSVKVKVDPGPLL